MQREKNITKEDTWKPAELRRHILDGGQGEDRVLRRDEKEKRHRGGESVERRHRDPEKDARRERNKHRESDSTGEGGKKREREKDGYQEKRREGSRDRRDDRVDRDRERRRERERLVDINKQGNENRERRHGRDGKETQERERDQEKSRDTERERVREREREDHNDRDKRREERDRERRREERDREGRREERDREHRFERERTRHEMSEEGMTEKERKHDREQRDREKGDRHRYREHLREREPLKDDLYDRRSNRERRERHANRNFAGQKEERGYKEELSKEQRERRHKERGQYDEKYRYGSEAREQIDEKESDGHHRGNRDQAEQESHRERRHRQETDTERSHKDKTSAKKPASDRGHVDNIKTSPTKGENVDKLAEDQDYGDQDYEDDFEDYEEDFEELDESPGENEPEREPHHPQDSQGGTHLAQLSEEIQAIQRAMDEENKRVRTAQSRQSVSTEEDDKPVLHTEPDKVQNRGSQHGKFIDFVTAKQREVHKKVANKQKKRSDELLRLIDLDYSATFSLLDLPPVSEYDMYIKTFGNTNTKQAYVQCNEDNTDRDIQTEEIELCEKWTQHPAEGNAACGDPHLSQEARDKRAADMNIDSQRLFTFLHTASQVMIVLLEEKRAERQALLKPRTHADALSFSDGSLQFNTKLPFLYGRQVSLVLFSEVERHTMLSVHSPTAEPSAVHLDSYTIICIWNIWEPSRPQKILVYESEVCCCCFSPGKATLVFAGTSVGSVILWDLREHGSNHYCLNIGNDEWILRHPTFSTDAVLATSGHLASVSSVEVVPCVIPGGMRPELPLSVCEEGSSGLSFQLASLDESGVVNLWVVVELPKANDAGSQTDLGLRPGGKVKLLHSSTLLTAERTSTRDTTKMGQSQTLLLKFQPTDSNSFFIGTNMGLVSHGATHGLKTLPKFYRSQEVGVRATDVTSIHFSPFKQTLFLVGCRDGSIRLHTVTHEQPLAEWRSSTANEPVVLVQWSQTRATLFCVMDAASTLYIWDLVENDLEPVVTERMTADRLTAIAVFGDSGQQTTYSGIALACQSGKIEVQYFTKKFSIPDTAEEKLERMIDDAF